MTRTVHLRLDRLQGGFEAMPAISRISSTVASPPWPTGFLSLDIWPKGQCCVIKRHSISFLSLERSTVDRSVGTAEILAADFIVYVTSYGEVDVARLTFSTY